MDNLVFRKKLGDHRGNPRLFFETTDIQPFGFVPGATYDIDGYSDSGIHVDRLELVIAADGKGRRKVCKKAKPSTDLRVIVEGSKVTSDRVASTRVLSVIDINSALYMGGFTGYSHVLVQVAPGRIVITKEAS